MTRGLKLMAAKISVLKKLKKGESVIVRGTRMQASAAVTKADVSASCKRIWVMDLDLEQPRVQAAVVITAV